MMVKNLKSEIKHAFVNPLSGLKPSKKKKKKIKGHPGKERNPKKKDTLVVVF